MEKTIKSTEIAKWVGRKHRQVLRDIRTLVEHLGDEHTFVRINFIKSFYLDNLGREQPSYELTKPACELYATRLTGAKGTQFALKYIRRFRELELALQEQLELAEEERAFREELAYGSYTEEEKEYLRKFTPKQLREVKAEMERLGLLKSEKKSSYTGQFAAACDEEEEAEVFEEKAGEDSAEKLAWPKESEAERGALKRAWERYFQEKAEDDAPEEPLLSSQETEAPQLPAARDQLRLFYEFSEDTASRVDSVESRVTDMEEHAFIDANDYAYLGRLINQRVDFAAKAFGELTREQRKILYIDINSGVKKVAGVATRSQLRKKHLQLVLDFVNDWELSSANKTILRNSLRGGA